VSAEEELICALCGVSEVLRSTARGRGNSNNNDNNDNNDDSDKYSNWNGKNDSKRESKNDSKRESKRDDKHNSCTDNDDYSDDCEDQTENNDNNRTNKKNKNRNKNDKIVNGFLAFQSLNSSSPEFLFMQEIVRNSNKIADKKTKNKIKTKTKNEEKSDDNSDNENENENCDFVDGLSEIEILKYFRIVTSSNNGNSTSETVSRIFTVLHINQFSSILVNGWSSLTSSSNSKNISASKNVFFSSNASVALAFFENKR
jgi:hypothetical protein